MNYGFTASQIGVALSTHHPISSNCGNPHCAQCPVLLHIHLLSVHELHDCTVAWVDESARHRNWTLGSNVLGSGIDCFGQVDCWNWNNSPWAILFLGGFSHH